jgi:RsiW-degrading membrane proteinase PrsW (M82 family)
MSALTNFPYAFAIGLVPSLIWLWFWIREDAEHPEPKFLISFSFLGGALAVIAAVFLEQWVQTFVSNEDTRYVLWAAIEECVKFAAVGIIALTTKYYDEPIDAMIYCIIGALGFAAIENALFIMTPLSSGSVVQTVVTGNMRFIGATIVHVVSSASVGFALGYCFNKGTALRILAVIVGLVAATAMHAGFNISIVGSTPEDTLKTFAWFWGATVILIVLFEEIKMMRPRQIT